MQGRLGAHRLRGAGDGGDRLDELVAEQVVVAARGVLRGRGLERGGQRDGGEGRGPHR